MRSLLKSRKFITAAYTIVFVALTVVALFQVGCSSSTPPSTPTTPKEAGGTPAATETVTIATPTTAPTPEATQPAGKKSNDVAPYSLSKGKRDPFVPFGGNAPAAAPQDTLPKETPKPVVTATEGKPVQPGKTPEAATPVAAPAEVVLPVQVTGTFVSGGKNFAILTSTSGGEAGAKGSPSFVVTSGDNVGEYRVKAITATHVVLLWNGKEYSIKIKSFGPGSQKGKASLTTTGEAPSNKTLPAPEKQAAPTTGGQPKTAPPPPPGSEPPAGSSDKAKGTEPAK